MKEYEITYEITSGLGVAKGIETPRMAAEPLPPQNTKRSCLTRGIKSRLNVVFLTPYNEELWYLILSIYTRNYLSKDVIHFKD